MYLDTDIILAIVKPTNWLKDVVEEKLKRMKECKTSLLIETEIVLNRKTSKEMAISVLEKVKERKVEDPNLL